MKNNPEISPSKKAKAPVIADHRWFFLTYSANARTWQSGVGFWMRFRRNDDGKKCKERWRRTIAAMRKLSKQAAEVLP